MERLKKKEIIEAVDSLISFNDSILQKCKTDGTESMIDALSECQSVAMVIGNQMEALGEEGEVSVRTLEEYCENLYQLSLHLTDEAACRKTVKKITKQLYSLKSEIQWKLPADKIEMVFFPYKASMWDSLESVWRAADEDPECEAYVVPIPYFDRNEKGELTTMHYEGDLFPKDVPIVHYQNYSLSERKPDIAFIHNPYDGYNYVTSVHPAYYIPKLKKHVGKVVYIPYYISLDVKPDNLDVQKQHQAMILSPGVLESDFVFLQSENRKGLFVNVLEKNVQGVKREYWESKIFGLGSPKLDRLRSMKRNDDLLPEEWRMLMHDENGQRKKVVFYNTSVSALLSGEGMMEKIEDTLAFFEKNRDYVLWWRPHPLYESTISAMRPGLLETYRRIVADYRSGGWGILDEGVDLDWAIAETDVYYGDGSSVAKLFHEAGKPVLHQNVKIKNSIGREKQNLPLRPGVVWESGEDIWFMHEKMNLLMKCHKASKSIEIIGAVPGECIWDEALYRVMYKEGDKLYLIPGHAHEIAVYDIRSKEFQKIAPDAFPKGNHINSEKEEMGKHDFQHMQIDMDKVMKIFLDNSTLRWTEENELLTLNGLLCWNGVMDNRLAGMENAGVLIKNTVKEKWRT